MHGIRLRRAPPVLPEGAARTHVAHEEDMAMTAFDFAPLSRSMIGFDRMFDLLQQASQLQLVENNPPYNIVKTDEDKYRITLAVAGYKPDELAVSWQPNRLLVSGRKGNQPDEGD